MNKKRDVTGTATLVERRSALLLGALSATALLGSLSKAASAEGESGVKVTVLYAPQKDPDAFTKYYLATHMPQVNKVPGVKRTEIATVLPNPPGQPASPYYRITEVYFENVGALQTSMASPEWKAVVADLPNFADPGTITGFASMIGG
jgi:uncharacterized protein (TIGR02118 family)